MKIRRAKKSDKKEFLKVQKEAFPNLDSRKQAKYFIGKLENKEIFVAIGKKDYLGHICFGEYNLNPPFTGGIFVEEFAVAKKSRGNSIGLVLLKFLIGYCKKNNFSVLYLGTGDYKGNKAIPYYKKLGFKKIGKLEEINPKSEYKYGMIFLGKIIR